MKIAAFGDVHVREKRLEEHRAILDDLVAQIFDFRPDLVLVLGDLAGLKVPHHATPKERNLLVGTLVRLAALPAPTVILRGNHDSKGDYSFLNHIPGLVYVEEPELLQLPEVAVVALPWLDRSSFAPDADYTASVRQAYAAALRKLEPELRPLQDVGKPIVLACHGAVHGAFLREGQPQVHTSDPLLDLDELLRSGVDFTAGFFGHYHTHQLLHPDPLCLYPGSTFVSAYGEDVPKGWVGWQDGEAAFYELPQRARVRLTLGPLEAPWLLDKAPIAALPDLPLDTPLGDFARALRGQQQNIDVKVVLPVPAGQEEAGRTALVEAKAILSLLVEGAIDLEPKYTQSIVVREGATEVRAAKGFMDKVDAYYRHLDPSPDEAIRTASLRWIVYLSESLS